MTTTDHGPALNRLRDLGLLAVLRGTDPDRVFEAAGVLIDEGIDVLEVTFTVPQCGMLIRRIKAANPHAVVGAGTVTNRSELGDAVEARADFIVTPGATPDLLTALTGTGVPFLPGVFTPSEVMAAREAGASGVKLFPGVLAGPHGLAALKGPFPDLLVVPTGGVSPDNLASWRRAGAFAVGAGGDLAPASAVDAGDHHLIRRNARRWCAALVGGPTSQDTPADLTDTNTGRK